MSWNGRQRRPAAPVCALAIDPSAPATLYAGTRRRLQEHERRGELDGHQRRPGQHPCQCPGHGSFDSGHALRGRLRWCLQEHERWQHVDCIQRRPRQSDRQCASHRSFDAGQALRRHRRRRLRLPESRRALRSRSDDSLPERRPLQGDDAVDHGGRPERFRAGGRSGGETRAISRSSTGATSRGGGQGLERLQRQWELLDLRRRTDRRRRRHDRDRQSDRDREELLEPSRHAFPADPGHQRVCDLCRRRDGWSPTVRRFCSGFASPAKRFRVVRPPRNRAVCCQRDDALPEQLPLPGAGAVGSRDGRSRAARAR